MEGGSSSNIRQGYADYEAKQKRIEELKAKIEDANRQLQNKKPPNPEKWEEFRKLREEYKFKSDEYNRLLAERQSRNNNSY